MKAFLGWSAKLALILCGAYVFIVIGMLIEEIVGSNLLSHSLESARVWILVSAIFLALIGLFSREDSDRKSARLTLMITGIIVVLQILLVLILAGLVAGSKQNSY